MLVTNLNMLAYIDREKFNGIFIWLNGVIDYIAPSYSPSRAISQN